jgi:hypothetical protein
MLPLPVKQTGIIQSKEGGTVILLPPGPIRVSIKGESGQAHDHVLVDDPDLGHPTVRIVHGQNSGDIYNHPY